MKQKAFYLWQSNLANNSRTGFFNNRNCSISEMDQKIYKTINLSKEGVEFFESTMKLGV